MKILKSEKTKIIILILACAITAFFSFKAIDLILKNQKLINNRTDYLSTYDYDYDIHGLYGNLWFIGNIYLKNTDSEGNYTCSKELQKSIETALKEKGLMDSDGTPIIDDKGKFEYYVKNGDAVISNTDKELNDISSSEYTWTYEAGEDKMPRNLDWWMSNRYWYSTDYGMYYYYYGGVTIAVFDYECESTKYYYDSNRTKIYYKTDGSTPIPDYIQPVTEPVTQFYSEAYSETELVEFYEEETTQYNEFTTIDGYDYELVIAIKPLDNLIEDYETAENLYIVESNTINRSVIYLIPLLIVLLVLTVYVIAIDGWSVKQNKYVLGKFRNIWGEVILLMIAIFTLGIATIIDSKTYFIELCDFLTTYTSIPNAPQIVGSILFTLVYLIQIFFICLMFRRIKCRCFWKTTLTGKIISKLLNTVKNINKKLIEKNSIKMLLRDDIFTQRFIIRLALCIVSEMLVILLAFAIESFGVIIICTFLILALYVFLSINDLRAINELSKHISDVSKGDYTAKEVPKNFVTYGMTQKLNNISDGIQNAVDEQLKSERMKIDLVTNVSHDLKTPLTSIISYINLLSAEELSPEASDYVKILEQKSERLKAIVSDLFDIAKATSNTDVDFENIDAVILMGQVTADMQDKIYESKKEIRMDISMETAPIYAEGKKLYRVFQNLIDNALKYSLNGTRIYIRLYENCNNVVVELKNISAYEMKFTPEEITERFTRGDESRTGEGNGLGLSIAKSFTEACNGQFVVKIDGDVFIAEVKFRLTK